MSQKATSRLAIIFDAADEKHHATKMAVHDALGRGIMELHALESYELYLMNINSSHRMHLSFNRVVDREQQ